LGFKPENAIKNFLVVDHPLRKNFFRSETLLSAEK